MGLGSGIRKKPIPDPESRGQKGTGSRIQGSKRHRIPDPDPQHCLKPIKVSYDHMYNCARPALCVGKYRRVEGK
jgi:hypothetical protein